MEEQVAWRIIWKAGDTSWFDEQQEVQKEERFQRKIMCIFTNIDFLGTGKISMSSPQRQLQTWNSCFIYFQRCSCYEPSTVTDIRKTEINEVQRRSVNPGHQTNWFPRLEKRLQRGNLDYSHDIGYQRELGVGTLKNKCGSWI